MIRGGLPVELRRSLELWVGCVAAALTEAEFLALLAEVGFEGGAIEPTRVYRLEDARAFLGAAGPAVEDLASAVDGSVMAAFVRARKPAARASRLPAAGAARTRGYRRAGSTVAPAAYRSGRAP